VALVAGKSVVRTARRGERLDVRVTGAPTELDGPLAQGATVGEVEVRQRGAVVARVPLITGAAIDAPTTLEQVTDVVERQRTPPHRGPPRGR
jgi:D-alanyl-D-alanine carboxypeptidase (penicillin-binding protein 5/6)